MLRNFLLGLCSAALVACGGGGGSGGAPSTVTTTTATTLAGPPSASTLPSKAAVLAKVALVNNNWQSNQTSTGDNKWANSVYHIGNLAAYEVTGNASYLKFSTDHAIANSWLINNGSFTDNADFQTLGQVYLSLTSDPTQLGNTRSQNDTFFISTAYDQKWTWIDAYFMQSAVLTKLGNLYGNGSGHDYHTQEAQMFDYMRTTLKLYDEGGSNLWYRDARFIPPAALTPGGKKVLWSRGNGWVFAALAKNLELLPNTAPGYNIYKTIFLNMAESLRLRQRTDGFWNSNLDDPANFGGPETSGTAAFTYGMALGVRIGLLDSATFQPVAAKGWNGMVATAVQSNGSLGYVQNVDFQPAATSISATSDFGVGLFLLAGSEIAKIAP